MASIPGIAGPGAGYPQWGVVAGSPGQHITKVTNAAAKYVMEAVAWPSKVYFFASEQAAKDWVSGHGGQVYIPGTQKPLQTANSALNTATGATTGVADFLTRLEKPATWLRIAEGAVGLILLGIAVNALLHNPAGKAARVAAKVRP